MKSNIHFRIAELKDCDNIYMWRNHPSIRQFSLDANKLDYSSHKRWFRKVLEDERHILLIAVHKDEEVGIIRYDIDEERNLANINIYVRPDRQNQGIGTKMIDAGESWLKKNKPFVKKIMATISKENLISLKLFQKAGFRSDFLLFFKNLE